MKANDIPCPYPPNFISGPPKAENLNDEASPPFCVPWGKEGGHLENATDDFIDATWGVSEGRRGGK